MLEYDFQHHHHDNFSQIMIKIIENLMACRHCMNQFLSFLHVCNETVQKKVPKSSNIHIHE